MISDSAEERTEEREACGSSVGEAALAPTTVFSRCASWWLTPQRTTSSLQIGIPDPKIGVLRGVLAQLVERLNGIEEVRGSNPLGSRIFTPAARGRGGETHRKKIINRADRSGLWREGRCRSLCRLRTSAGVPPAQLSKRGELFSSPMPTVTAVKCKGATSEIYVDASGRKGV